MELCVVYDFASVYIALVNSNKIESGTLGNVGGVYSYPNLEAWGWRVSVKHKLWWDSSGRELKAVLARANIFVVSCFLTIT